jgi:pyrimidine oxygenase
VTKVSRPVEYGVFLPVSDGGFIFSDTAPKNPATYAYQREVSRLAEKLGLGFVIALARWRGFGGTRKTEYRDTALESFTAATGLAASTERVRVFCTLHTMAYHPAVAAKMMATADQVSGGRIGLNIVAGSNPIDHGQMGLWRKDIQHDELYAVATEWITVAKRLWSEDTVDFAGKYYNLVDCQSDPKPVQRPHPTLICAAVSETGYEFTMRHADASLVNGTDLEDLIKNGQRNKAKAKELGTKTKTVGLMMAVPGKTDAEAEERVKRYNDGADVEALATRAWQYSQSAREWSHDQQVRLQQHTMMPDGKHPIAVTRSNVTGSPATLADKIADVVERGDFDWLSFYFPDYLNDVKTFGEEVLPRLVDRGIGLRGTEKPSLLAPAAA